MVATSASVRTYLCQVRRHWALYIESAILPEEEKQAIRASVESGMKYVRDQFQDNAILTRIRSAGPPFMCFAKKAMKSHTAYWSTGTTKFDSFPVATLPRFNPTFLYSVSGKKFAVHCGTESLIAFHLAPALIQIKDVESLTSNMKNAMRIAMDQFTLWCSAFRRRIYADSAIDLKIGFHVGESLEFCQALLLCQRSKVTKSGIYTSQWGGSQIVLDENDWSGYSTLAPLQHYRYFQYNTPCKTSESLDSYSPITAKKALGCHPHKLSRARKFW